MNISIIGAGYVGLVSGTCYSTTGNRVTIVDIDQNRIDLLRSGQCPIYEPGLEALIRENVQKDRLSFTTDIQRACQEADVIGIAVGTPEGDDGSCDLRYVEQAAEQIGRFIDSYCVVVTKSTVPVGTGDRIQSIIADNTSIEFDYVSNPEFLKEGSAVEDFMFPERVIIGTESDKARRMMKHLYSPFVRRSHRIYYMDVRSAEMSKYACNAMLALRISFMNDLAKLADAVGADISAVRQAMGSDSRIGNAFLYPGLGYGGSCFPKDVQALAHTARLHDLTLRLVEDTHEINRDQADYFLQKINAYYGGQLEGKHFAVWGLAFKARTDDVRESPAFRIITPLIEAKATVCAYDPEARQTAHRVLGDRIEYADLAYDALESADGLIVCTEWLEFRTPDFRRMADRMRRPVVFDGRNLYDAEFIRVAGFDYVCVGRPRDEIVRTPATT